MDGYIKSSIAIKGNYSELSYERPLDYRKISTLLLLFNVESVRQNGQNSEWFPFDKFKYNRGSKVVWSLEHMKHFSCCQSKTERKVKSCTEPTE